MPTQSPDPVDEFRQRLLTKLDDHWGWVPTQPEHATYSDGWDDALDLVSSWLSTEGDDDDQS